MAREVNRRDFMAAAGASVAAVSAAGRGNAQQPSAARKRNVLIYVTDDQGRADAGCYGNSVIKTPGLDRLASGGARFTHAFCTTASC
ncbi:MAG TPA: sulfatase-like hydrolase/transferase, partial [Candidatus Hydrogenedentes bacterium]|nr:sulfatase-like hydrolase/transferase [Candidatus Hydrogenedentota bacterium]